MPRVIGFAALFLVLAIQSRAQDCCKRAEFAFGYSYLNASAKTDRVPPDLSFNSRINQHGIGAEFALNLTSRWGVIADFSRQAANVNRIKADTITRNLLFGARLSKRSAELTTYCEALAGVFYRRTVFVDSTISHGDFALAVGGGFDIQASRSVAIRLLRFDYIPVRGADNSPDSGTRWSHNFRAQAGIVVRFGGYLTR